jgi:hypothetical protein
LNEILIQNLLAHLNKHGKLIALEELQTVDGFESNTIQMLLPFVQIKAAEAIPDPNFHMLLHEGKSSWLLRSSRIIEQQSGYSDQRVNPYLGSPYSFYSRYRFVYYKRLSFGITAEKDPGEEFFRGSQKRGFDFYSAHLYLTDYKRFKQLAIGDYQAQFGQGLTFWSGLAFGGGLGISGLKRAAKGLSPYTSAQEDLFLRGVGVTSEFKDLQLTLFYSRRAIDANLDEDEGRLSSFYGNGLHRTTTELEKRSVASEQIMGSHLSWKKDRYQIGLTAVERKLSIPLEKADQIYRQFDSPEQRQANFGTDYQFYLANLLFFGETSYSANGGIASLTGLLWLPAKGVG